MANAKWAKPTATIILDEDAFDEKGIQKAGFKTMNPIEELNIGDRNIIVSPITTLTKESLKDSGLDLKAIVRCKNMFTLGMCFFMFNKELDHTFEYLERKFKKKPALIETNKKVLKDGFNYASNIHAIANTYYVQPAKQEKAPTATSTATRPQHGACSPPPRSPECPSSAVLIPLPPPQLS